MHSLFTLSLFAAATRAAIGPVTNITLSNVELSPDGYLRETAVFNGQFPGPLITGNKNDFFAFNVSNALGDTDLDTVTSIHWHGLWQHGTSHEDGVAFVTQCPVIPDGSFEYKFVMPNQTGTYWYHSHYKSQYCDGARGALVIYDPDDPQGPLYDVDDENTVITLADWYHYLSTDAPTGAATPNSTLINGKGRYLNGPLADLAIVNVEQGKRYRLRLVSMSCDTYWTFSIDGHNFTVIEVDATPHASLDIDSLEIFAGQRYSLVMAADQPVDNYWIRAAPNNIDGNYKNGMNSAILRYAGAPTSDPTTNSSTSQLLNEQDLHPFNDGAAPGDPWAGGADVTIELNTTYVDDLFYVNNATFSAPSVPVLLQILNGVPAQSLMPNGSVYTLPANKTIELVIPGGVVGGPHPIHLHGHTFSVVRSAGNDTYNYVNPPKRDVVSIGTSTTDQTTIRFTTDNAGPWFLHCHIDWHLNTGFAVVMAEDVADVSYYDQPGDDWKAMCPAYNSYMDA